ncbi:hypothetical protein ACOSQ3_000166 [Xanthoceras sorbifolium]
MNNNGYAKDDLPKSITNGVLKRLQLDPLCGLIFGFVLSTDRRNSALFVVKKQIDYGIGIAHLQETILNLPEFDILQYPEHQAVGLWPSWGFWVGEERETEQETEAVSAESGLFSQTLDDARTTTKVAENLSLSGENKRRKTRAISLPFLAGRSWSSFLILGVLKSPRKDPKALVPRIGPLSHETP